MGKGAENLSSFLQTERARLLGSESESASSESARVRLCREVLSRCAGAGVVTHGLVSPLHMASGSPKFNLALVAMIFATRHGLPALTEQVDSNRDLSSVRSSLQLGEDLASSPRKTRAVC